MITKPLDLASRLRPAPRSYDVLFLVNVALIGLFFMLFGSRFVLSPGLGLDFELPKMPGVIDGAAATTAVVSIKRSNQAFVDPDGYCNYAQLRRWMAGQVKLQNDTRLLIIFSASVPTNDLFAVYEMAREAGFKSIQLAAEPSAASLAK